MRDYRVFLEGHELDNNGDAVTKMELTVQAFSEWHAKAIVKRAHSYWNFIDIVEIT